MRDWSRYDTTFFVLISFGRIRFSSSHSPNLRPQERQVSVAGSVLTLLRILFLPRMMDVHTRFSRYRTFYSSLKLVCLILFDSYDRIFLEPRKLLYLQKMSKERKNGKRFHLHLGSDVCFRCSLQTLAHL